MQFAQTDAVLAEFPLAAKLFADKRINAKHARDRQYMAGVERELQRAQTDRQSRQGVDQSTRYDRAPPPARRFKSTKQDPAYPGLSMYQPPRTTAEPLFTNDSSQWGYGHAQAGGSSILGTTGEAMGVAGGLAAATGIGAAAGAPLAIAGGVLKGVDIVGSDFAGWW